ncbi:MAG: hypothetical protein KDD82_19650 [Planctomycetes bacterium]|nr:hypothetical protein [Planctomycetota bacterium]
MAVNRKTTARLILESPVTAADTVVTARTRVNGILRPVARVTGTFGFVVLLLVLALRLLPEERWPGILTPDHWPFYFGLSLAVASLLGWTFMLEGLVALRQRTGWTIGGWLFVFLPVVCALLTASHAHGWVAWDEVRHGWLLGLARWYPPGVVGSCLFAFWYLDAKKHDGKGARTALTAALITPYVLLFGTLALGFRVELLADSWEETLHSLGSWALVLQIALAFFAAGGA